MQCEPPQRDVTFHDEYGDDDGQRLDPDMGMTWIRSSPAWAKFGAGQERAHLAAMQEARLPAGRHPANAVMAFGTGRRDVAVARPPRFRAHPALVGADDGMGAPEDDGPFMPIPWVQGS